jgi:hypothetical protein
MIGSRAICLACATILLVGCTVATLPGASTADGLASQAPDAQSVARVDPSVAQVSLSNPSPDAQQALDLCNAKQYGLDKVARIGLIARAHDAIHYVPLQGIEPEIQTDSPAFIIQFQGEIPQPMYNGETWIDPICVVIDGESGFYATGPRLLADGRTIAPDPVPLRPDRLLPTPKP